MASIKSEPTCNKRSREEQTGPSRWSLADDETQSHSKRPRIILHNVSQMSSAVHAYNTAVESSEMSSSTSAESVVADAPEREPDARFSNSEWEGILRKSICISDLRFLYTSCCEIWET